MSGLFGFFGAVELIFTLASLYLMEELLSIVEDRCKLLE